MSVLNIVLDIVIIVLLSAGLLLDFCGFRRGPEEEIDEDEALDIDPIEDSKTP